MTFRFTSKHECRFNYKTTVIYVTLDIINTSPKERQTSSMNDNH